MVPSLQFASCKILKCGVFNERSTLGPKEGLPVYELVQSARWQLYSTNTTRQVTRIALKQGIHANNKYQQIAHTPPTQWHYSTRLTQKSCALLRTSFITLFHHTGALWLIKRINDDAALYATTCTPNTKVFKGQRGVARLVRRWVGFRMLWTTVPFSAELSLNDNFPCLMIIFYAKSIF